MPSENYTTPFLEFESLSNFKIGIVSTSWNLDIVDILLKNSTARLLEYGIQTSQLIFVKVPGTFELVYGSMRIIEEHKVDAVLAFGCVIKGATQHDEYINHAVAQGLINLTIQKNIPCIFGVLTTNSKKQAWERADGTYGNKGKECAEAALNLLNLNFK